MRFFRRSLPLINFTISSTALLFQMTVLNPWHNKISKQLDDVKNLYEKKIEITMFYSSEIVYSIVLIVQ